MSLLKGKEGACLGFKLFLPDNKVPNEERKERRKEGRKGGRKKGGREENHDQIAKLRQKTT